MPIVNFNSTDMKKIIYALLLLMFQMPALAGAAQDEPRREVLLKTDKGDILLALYNETPRHRDNFIRLVKSGYYNGVLFHRVISNFMIQCGDSTTRHAAPGAEVGAYSPDYTVPAEIVYPKFFHRRGVLAAARESDDVNPERASSSSQFYIVYGHRFTEDGLDQLQARLDKTTNGKIVLAPETREIYKTLGGTPHLDGQYTVFGEVLSGMDVVKEIQSVETDAKDRPLEDVRIVEATVVK